MMERLLNWFGYVKKAQLSGVAIGMQAQKDLDLLYEKTGFRSHKVGSEQNFNGFVRTAGNPEAEEVESLLFKYANAGYVFTNEAGVLISNICTITTKEDRV